MIGDGEPDGAVLSAEAVLPAATLADAVRLADATTLADAVTLADAMISDSVRVPIEGRGRLNRRRRDARVDEVRFDLLVRAGCGSLGSEKAGIGVLALPL